MRWFALVAVLVACGPDRHQPADAKGDVASGSDADVGDAACSRSCADDLHSIVDCHDMPLMICSDTDACDTSTLTCVDACSAAADTHASVGCDYYATDTETAQPTYCYAAFVANTWTTPAHITVELAGSNLNVAAFTRIPAGNGPGLTYTAYDPVAGLASGQVAILFLGGNTGNAPACPVAAAVPAAAHNGNGIFSSFHITTDVPVVAYQINPYGGGAVAITAASLLLPTSAWDTDYVAVTPGPGAGGHNGSMNIVAAADNTTVTITPTVAVTGGNGIPASAAQVPFTLGLSRGQQAQITQQTELTGSTIVASKPVGFMTAHNCMMMPVGVQFCDHAEQMLPPSHALGHRYAGVMYRPRVPAETATFWKLVGVADGTQLTYSSAVGGPTTLDKGQSVTFSTGTPFVVESQDDAHPFELFTYMTGSTYVADGYGDPDFVVSVPPEQYLSRYVFFADPTYPETNLVVVRTRGTDGQFHDVDLDCAGTLTGWTALGDYEWTRTDLTTGDFANVGNCSTGPHVMKSAAPFGLWVWGWGTPNTTTSTVNVSYGYPAGMNVARINQVIIQ